MGVSLNQQGLFAHDFRRRELAGMHVAVAFFVIFFILLPIGIAQFVPPPPPPPDWGVDPYGQVFVGQPNAGL